MIICITWAQACQAYNYTAPDTPVIALISYFC
jgi:hypothetical protein